MEQSDIEFVQNAAGNMVKLEELFDYIKTVSPAVDAALTFQPQIGEVQALKLAIISLYREHDNKQKKTEEFLVQAAVLTQV